MDYMQVNPLHPLHNTIVDHRGGSGRLLSLRCRTERFKRSFAPAAIRLSNSRASRLTEFPLGDKWSNFDFDFWFDFYETCTTCGITSASVIHIHGEFQRDLYMTHILITIKCGRGLSHESDLFTVLGDECNQIEKGFTESLNNMGVKDKTLILRQTWTHCQMRTEQGQHILLSLIRCFYCWYYRCEMALWKIFMLCEWVLASRVLN